MKGLILVNAYSQNEEYLYQSKRLKEEFEKLGVKIDIKKNNNFDLIIEDNKIISKYKDYNFVIFLDKDKYVLSMIEKIEMPVFNSYQSIIDCDDKMMTYIKLSNNEIPMPKTLPGLLCYSINEEISENTIITLEDNLGYPMIAKYSYGSLGQGVKLANNRTELHTIMNEMKCSPHLFQEFINTSFGKDIRIIVIGNDVIGGMLRQSHGDFRSNIGAGGFGEPYVLNDELVELALKIKNILGLDYCGIDILFGKNGPVVCEVNSNAFFYSFEHVTGINVAKKYAEYILDKMKRIR